MTRVLTKGTRTGVENNHATWDEAENLIDHNLAFYDLATLEEQKHEVTHPAFSLDNSLTLPSHTDVAQYLDGGNDLWSFRMILQYYQIHHLPETIEKLREETSDSQ